MFNTKTKRDIRSLSDNVTDLYMKLKNLRDASLIDGEMLKGFARLNDKVDDIDKKYRTVIQALLKYLDLDLDLDNEQKLYVKKGSNKASSGKERGFANNKTKKETVAVGKKNNSTRGKTSSKRK